MYDVGWELKAIQSIRATLKLALAVHQYDYRCKVPYGARTMLPIDVHSMHFCVRISSDGCTLFISLLKNPQIYTYYTC
jgi:hypothetical protein